MLKCLLCLGILTFPFLQVRAEPIQLATGDFPPFVGESLPENGIDAEIVRAVFARMGKTIELVFLPWNRAMKEVVSGKYPGSFPWAINDERKKDLLFSIPLIEDKIRYFVKKGRATDDLKNWEGKKICIPRGWDISQAQKEISRFHMVLQQPMEIQHCFSMLHAGRVDVTAVNQMNGFYIIKTLFGKNSGIEPMGKEISKDLTYFVVPKTNPGSEKLLSDFNRELKKLIESGEYAKILKKYR